MDLRILAITLPLLALTLIVSGWRKTLRADWLAILGLACTLIGDYFLAMTHAPKDSWRFVYGVAGFSLAHGCWMAHLLRQKRLPQFAVLVGLLTPLLPYLYIQVLPNAVSHVGVAIVLYTILSCLSLSCAVASGKPLWMLAIGSLFISDFFISAGSFTDDPLLGRYVAPFYLLALVSVAVAVLFSKPSFELPYNSLNNNKIALFISMILYLFVVGFFVFAMLKTPSGHYQPLRQMLSYLGRRKVDGVAYPLCHYLFVLGMTFSALALAVATPHLAAMVKWKRLRWLAELAGALTAGGLVMIALIPEDVNMGWHCNGCGVAALGGGLFLVMLWPRRWEWLLAGELLLVFGVFEVCIFLHRMHRIPFVPAVPTLQKALIVSFMLWGIWQCVKAGRRKSPSTAKVPEAKGNSPS